MNRFSQFPGRTIESVTFYWCLGLVMAVAALVLHYRWGQSHDEAPLFWAGIAFAAAFLCIGMGMTLLHLRSLLARTTDETVTAVCLAINQDRARRERGN